MHRGQAQAHKERRQLRAEYGEMFDACTKAMHDVKLLGIVVPGDEYDIEAVRVVPRLPGCLSLREVQRVLHEEIPPMFGDGIQFSPEVLESPAARLWRLMSEHGWR